MGCQAAHCTTPQTGHPFQIGEIAERPVILAIPHDGSRQPGPDARQPVQLGLTGQVRIDPLASSQRLAAALRPAADFARRGERRVHISCCLEARRRQLCVCIRRPQ